MVKLGQLAGLDRKSWAVRPDVSLSMDCKMDSPQAQVHLDCSGPGRLERGAGSGTSELLFAHFVPAAGMVKVVEAIIMAEFVSITSSLVSIIMDARVQAEEQAIVILSELLLVLLQLEDCFNEPFLTLVC